MLVLVLVTYADALIAKEEGYKMVYARLLIIFYVCAFYSATRRVF